MQIFVLIPFNPFETEGASANRWRSILEGLAQQNIRLHLLILSGFQSRKEFTRYRMKGTISNYSNINYTYLTFQFNSNIWLRRLNIYILDSVLKHLIVFKVTKLLKQNAFDILFLHPSLPVFQVFEKLDENILVNTKVMMEINEFNDFGKEHKTNVLQVKKVDLFNDKLKRVIFPKLDFCLVITKRLIKHFSGFPNLKKNITFFHLPMTVDLNRFQNLKPSMRYKKPYIAYCGTSNFKKDGVDILIKSFNIVASKHPTIRLYIAAFLDADNKKMIDLINESKFKDRISYLGSLRRDEIPSFISGATLCALSRPDSRQAQGGFPTKLGEYLATGRPVCVTTVGEIPDYLMDDKSAYFARPGDIYSFANAISRAMKGGEQANKTGQEGKKIAEEHFNMEIQAMRLKSFLESHEVVSKRFVS